ncbi:MAG: hypothetical protein RLZZ53_2732, partial [Acidobacteriota bacterium]
EKIEVVGAELRRQGFGLCARLGSDELLNERIGRFLAGGRAERERAYQTEDQCFHGLEDSKNRRR